MPQQYSDIPEGAEIISAKEQPAQQYSDVPAGATIERNGTESKTDVAMSQLSGLDRIKAYTQGAVSMAGDLAGMAAGGIVGTAEGVGRYMLGESGEDALRAGADRMERVSGAASDYFAPDDPNEAAAKAEMVGGIQNITQDAVRTAKQVVSSPARAVGVDTTSFVEGDLGQQAGDLARDAGASPVEQGLIESAPTVLEMLVGSKGLKAIDEAAAPAGRVNVPGRVPRETAPTPAQLKARAGQKYDAVDSSGIRVHGPSVKAQLERMLKSEDIVAGLTPGTRGALRNAIKMADENPTLTMKQVEQVRRLLKKPAGSNVPADVKASMDMAHKWDDFIEKLDESAYSIPEGQSREAALANIRQGRELYSRSRKAEEISDLIEKAARRADGNYTGSGFEHQLRILFRQLADNKRRLRTFSPTEQELIKKVATGTPGDNLFRNIGKMAPTGELGAWLTIGAFMANPATAVIPAIGTAGRAIATKRGIGRARAVEDAVRTGRQDRQ